MPPIETFIGAHIRANATALVHLLAAGWFVDHVNDGMDEIHAVAQGLCCPVLDYEAAARAAGWEATPCDAEIQKHGEDRTCFGADRWQVACERDGIRPAEREIRAFYVVSHWLAYRLDLLGERVNHDFAGLRIWARTSKGGLEACPIMRKLHGEGI